MPYFQDMYLLLFPIDIKQYPVIADTQPIFCNGMIFQPFNLRNIREGLFAVTTVNLAG